MGQITTTDLTRERQRPRAQSAARRERLWTRWSRRALTLGGLSLAWTLVMATLPLTLLITSTHDLLRGRWRLPSCRFVVCLAFALSMELVGVVAALGLWVVAGGPWARQDARWLARHFRVQAWWSGTLFRVFSWLYRLDVREEGAEAATLERGPVIVFARHASTADTLLPSNFIANVHGLRLRYVIKRELLWDPCLDLFGQRLPNHFVDRASTNSAAEIEAIGTLLEALEARDGVLIYPEGTRFTHRKRERILEKLAAAGDADAQARAHALRHTLPPRIGGSVHLLQRNPGADVVILGHTGFEGVQRLDNLINGRLIGQTVHLRFWRFPADEIPRSHDALVEWIHARWLELDDWIDARRTPEPDRSGA